MDRESEAPDNKKQLLQISRIVSTETCIMSRSYHTPVTPKQPKRMTTNADEINRREKGLNTCLEQFATDRTDPWQIVPIQVFTPHDYLLTSVALDVL